MKRKHVASVALLILLFGGFTVCCLYFHSPGLETIPDNPVDPGLGRYIIWSQVDQLYPRGAYATVRDYETGLEFKVQRRAGRFHADVQPLTAVDTAVMRQIYANKWSWRRRSVIVILESGVKLAASMNGMPHGAGAIEGNNFNGHFCIHFPESKTHTSRNIDLAHQMMIWKAAGMMEEKLAAMDGRSLLRVLLTAIDQGEQRYPACIVTGAESASFLQAMSKVQSLQVREIQAIDSGHFQVTLLATYEGMSRSRPCSLQIFLEGPDPYYKIPAENLRELAAPLLKAAVDA